MVRLSTPRDFSSIQRLWDGQQIQYLSPVLRALLELHPIEYYRGKTLVFTVVPESSITQYFCCLEDLPHDLQEAQSIHTYT